MSAAPRPAMTRTWGIQPSLGQGLTMAGLLLVGLALVWSLHLIRPWLARIPPNWSFQAEYLGDAAYGDGTLTVPEVRQRVIMRRDIRVLDWQTHRAVIEDRYQTFLIDGGTQVWESRLRFEVDPWSGRHLAYPGHPEAAGLYYVFPQGAGPRSYRLFNNNLNPYTLDYVRSEELDGTTLHVYRFRGDLEAAGWYAGSEDYPGVVPPPEQTIRAQAMTIEYWVEPASGETVKITEETAGDWLVDRNSGRRLALVSVWAGTSTASSSRDLLDAARYRRQVQTLISRWIPGLLVLTGLWLIGLARFLCRRS